ncbi:MAG: ferrous iron transport protein B [Bifidobacterium sp.]|uniref:ferrous iron transport protein B n=1 Tax=Bifidobacterium sp. TaxID=41200 RepID=UPI0039E81F10
MTTQRIHEWHASRCTCASDAASNGSAPRRTGEPHVVLVGNPNVGKSTMFNALAGGNAKVMNAPGTTVMIETAHLRHLGEEWTLVDTPGTSSLEAISPDEQVACEAAMGIEANAVPDVIVAFINALSPSRSLYLLSQLIDLGRPIVVAVTMLDLAKRQGSPVTLDGLRMALPDLEFVGVDGRTSEGRTSLLKAIKSALSTPSTPSPNGHRRTQGKKRRATGVRAVPDAQAGQKEVSAWVEETADERFDWVADIMHDLARQNPSSDKVTMSDRIDRILLHPVSGIAVFLAVMYLVFESITTLANPCIDFVDVTLRQWLTDAIDWVFNVSLGSQALQGWFHDLVINGVLNGAVTVLTFVPPMGIMFMILSLLEDSGYLSRAAFVMDKAMRIVGLDGRAFLPLVVGFGCNLPALASTRTLPDSRQRLLTGLLIPFTSCSARLSVFVVLAYAFFGNYAGLAIFLMYVASIVIILTAGFALRKTQFGNMQAQPFAMELPPYQLPKPLRLAKSVCLRLWAFITGASTIIISATIVMWLLAAIPVSAGIAGTNSFGHVDSVEHSVYGVVASRTAALFNPAGFGDMHASAALITGFVAKEVVVGSMSQSYSIDDSGSVSESAQGRGALGTAVRESFEQSSGGHAAAAGAAFMIFVLAYTPCLATIAEMKRQFGTRAAAQSVAMGLIIAYVLAVVVFQLGRLL